MEEGGEAPKGTTDENEESNGPKAEPVKLGWVLGVQVSDTCVYYADTECRSSVVFYCSFKLFFNTLYTKQSYNHQKIETLTLIAVFY